MTLIELLVVLVIMGALLGVSVAALGRISQGDASLAESLDEVMVAARTEAARRAEPVHLRIDGVGRYELVAGGQDSPFRSGELPVEAVEPAPAEIAVFPPGTALGGRIRFRWDGAWHPFEIDPVAGGFRPLP